MLSRYFRVRNWNILSKIVGVNLIILLVASLAIIFYIIPLYEHNLQKEHKIYTSSLVDMATSVLNHYHSKVLGNEMSLAEAQQGAIATIRIMANRNDYIWIHDLNLIMVLHPYAPHLEQKSLADFKDPSGRRIFTEMNQLLKSNGNGYLEYLWPKPSSKEPQPKLSYFRLFEPWGWVVGSGIYYNDEKFEAMSLRRQVVAVASTLFAAIILFSLYAARRINRPLKQALRITSQISSAHQPDIMDLETSDEPRRLLHAIETMVTDLKESRDEAERANRSKSDFLARMSHEIRTPMNAITGMTELAMESATTLEQKEYLEGVRSSADHLTELINDILDFSKIDAGHLALERIPFSLRETLRVTAQPMIFRVRQKGLTFETSIPPSVPDRLLGDPVRLRQIITNLLGNAIKFTSRGGILLSVSETSPEGEDIVLAFGVRDTGMGIAEGAREHIFNPFVQADSTTTRKFGGTGLGLAIVRQLVEMMGGHVSVTSEVGQGSEFRFSVRFGLAVDQAHSRDIKMDENPSLPAQPVNLRSLSVLVAEDVEMNQVVVSRFLEKLGHRAIVVANGVEAVEAWLEGAFDVVLMDVQMPEMDGLAATRAIREHEEVRGGHIPIIAMTAHAMQEDAVNCLEAGMDAHLAKPLKKSDLAAALGKI